MENQLRMLNRSSLFYFTLILVLTSHSWNSLAEGTKEVAPNAVTVIDGSTTNDIAALLINHTEYNRFATYQNNDPNSRLYIHISDPTVECIYLGLSVGHVNGNNSTPAQLSYEYRIKDPNGNIVFGPITVNPGDENITNWAEAFNGPQALVGGGGYNQVLVSSLDLMSSGWSTAGDYYIEFQNLTSANELLIDYWDFSVVNCLGVIPEYKPGRVWSYNWAFFAVNDFGFPNRPFNGSFHVCAPDPDDPTRAFITKIDFDESGFQPAAFNIAFNSFGSQNTGIISIDRQSRESINSTQSEYAIFLNDPIDLCETALSGEITLLGIGRCSDDDYCIKFTATKEGQVELLLDFDGNDNIFTPGTADVQITQEVTATEVGIPTCLNWDGLNGLGQPMIENMTTTIPVTIAFAQGIYHFPIYDSELMLNGFNISSVRPTGPTPSLYYDDTQISAPSGSGEPNLQLSGCMLPCHRWTNYTDGGTVGFGNLNTINSWWFSQLLIEQELIFLPGYYVCNINGPDTLCENNIDTLMLDLEALPTGISNPTIISQRWSGPGIVGSNTGAEIIIDAAGSYQVDIIWVNNLGDECRTSCLKTVVFSGACCSVSMNCGSDSTWYGCNENAPLPAASIDELINIGLLEVTDIECSNLRMEVQTTIETGNCATEPETTTYDYLVWNDKNGNGQTDMDEVQTNCQQLFLTQDTEAPSLAFTGDLEGMQSGDTLFIQCQAADPDWSIPMPSVDDISVNDECSEVTVELSDAIVDGDCMVDGFIKSYRCSWLAADACGNETELVIYMLLVDKIAPEITDVAVDITISCSEKLPQPFSTASDECNCAHMTVEVDTLFFICASNYQIRRTYNWVDHCENKSTAEQLVTVSDDQSLTVTLPDGYVNGQEIESNCEGGILPAWLIGYNNSSIAVISLCNAFTTRFELIHIESNDCSGGYLAKYKLEWIVTDDCGRIETAHFMVKIVDHEPPSILAYPPIKCDGTFDPALLIAGDNCFVSRIEHDQMVQSSICDNSLEIKHTWNVYDQCGNFTYGELIVPMGDTTPPLLTLPPPYENLVAGSTIEIDCQTNIETYFSEKFLIVQNTCDEVNLTREINLIENNNCLLGHVGRYEIVWTATDECGNISQFQLFAQRTAPDLTNLISDDIVKLSCLDEIPELDIDNCIAQVDLVGEQIQSNCANQLSFRAYTILGICGDQMQDTLWISFTDNEPPTFNDFPDQICGDDDLPFVQAWDECEQQFVSVTSVQRVEMICGVQIPVISYSAIDRCGNEARRDINILPNLIEQQFKLYYNNLEISNGIIGWPIIDENCPFELDPTQFRIEPSCPIVSLNYDYILEDQNCENSNLFENRRYTINLETNCGTQAEYFMHVQLSDRAAPVFIDPPQDITISCTDTVACPNINVLDNCSAITVIKDQVVLPGLPGSISYLQTWTASDACMNESQHERIVTQFEAPTCEIIVPNAINCNSSHRLESDVESTAEPLTYEWQITQGDCLIKNNGSSDSFIDIVMFSDTASVILIVTDAFGCQSDCEVQLICVEKPVIPQPLPLSTSPNLQGVQLFPNPFIDQLQYRSEQEINSIIVRNLQGQFMLNISSATKTGSIDLEHLQSGLYFIELNSEQGDRTVIRLLKM